jgi:hypothetical protein
VVLTPKSDWDLFFETNVFTRRFSDKLMDSLVSFDKLSPVIYVTAHGHSVAAGESLESDDVVDAVIVDDDEK